MNLTEWARQAARPAARWSGLRLRCAARQAGQVSVTRGGRRLLRTRANLDAAAITKDQRRAEWDAARLS